MQVFVMVQEIIRRSFTTQAGLDSRSIFVGPVVRGVALGQVSLRGFTIAHSTLFRQYFMFINPTPMPQNLSNRKQKQYTNFIIFSTFAVGPSFFTLSAPVSAATFENRSRQHCNTHVNSVVYVTHTVHILLINTPNKETNLVKYNLFMNQTIYLIKYNLYINQKYTS